MGEPQYSSIIQRILDILQADDTFKEKISEFRFGELPEQTYASSYPAVYISTSTKPEVLRRTLGPSSGHNRLPRQEVVTEFWVVILASEAVPSDTQTLLYSLRNDVVTLLGKNIQLRNADGDEPLCSSLELFSTERLTAQRGKLLDGITVVIRCINFVNSPA